MIEIFDKFDELDERALEQCVRRLSREVDEGKVEACWQLAALYEDGRGVERDARRAFELREQGARADEPNAIVWLAYAYEHAVGTRYDLSKALELYERAIENFGAFRSRVFACCQTSIHRALRRAKSLSIQEKLVDGSTFYQTIVDVDAEDKRAQEIYEQCDPSADPLYCVELSYALRDLGEPKELSEEVASSLDDEAFVMLEKAARRGNAVAMSKLADAYVNDDKEYAIDLLRRAAEAGCAAAIVKIGYMLEGEEFDDDALEFYLKAAELDYPDGLCKAGSLYEKRGQTEEAVRLYRRGAQLGHAPSLYVLGNYCWSSTDDENKAFAVDCWRRSAEARFPFAMERYAEYLESELDENDSREAWAEVAKYYKGATNEGIDSSKVAYATMLYKGLGVDKDEREAARLFREIEESGDLESKEELAALKYKGEGCERDVEGAIRLLSDAAEESVSAQIALGWQYFSGENVPVDEYRAAQLIGKAAKSGASEALAVFSRFCYEGRGVPRDDLAGEYFLRLAAESGDPSSASRLGHMFADGDFGRPLQRKVIDPGADRGEGHGLAAVLARKAQAAQIAGGQQLLL
ncbi:MAG: sel1 repeat family protein, partial [Thermoguttaceae bacterium]|nr:sel1 repeat family protein [Thermoguttaceae bacterium]